jgi:hypothetical protein
VLARAVASQPAFVLDTVVVFERNDMQPAVKMVFAVDAVESGETVAHRLHQVNHADSVKAKDETILWVYGLQNLV